MAAGQQPFAIVLGCSDSRVPAEIVFDQGLGDLFVIRVAQRDALRAALAADGIETGIHYPIALPRQPALRHLGYEPPAFPNTEELAVQMVSLPMYPELPLEDVEWVAAAIRGHLGR